MKLNAKEWPYIVVGIFFSAIAGGMPVLFAIILAEILQVGDFLLIAFINSFINSFSLVFSLEIHPLKY